VALGCGCEELMDVSYERVPMPQCNHCELKDHFHAYVYYTCSFCGELVCGRHLEYHTAQHQPPETEGVPLG